MRYIFVLFLCFSSFFVSSCDSVHEIEIGEIEDAVFKSFNNNIIEFDLIMPIDNPSVLSFRIIKVDFDVYVNNQDIGFVSNVDNVKIPSRSSDLYTFPLKAELRDLLRGALSLAGVVMQREAKIRVKGHIEVKSFLYSRKIDFDEETVVFFD